MWWQITMFYDFYSRCVYSNCPILDEDEKLLNSWQPGMEEVEQKQKAEAGRQKAKKEDLDDHDDLDDL